MAFHQVIFGLGSNCQPRHDYLRTAIEALETDETLGLESLMQSQVYESDPLLPIGAPEEWNMRYLNMVICGFTSASPEKILIRAKAIEQKLGRRDRGWWGPREIDIDILAVDDMVMNRPHLTLPHAEMLKRDFVMVPLADVLPNWRHPGDNTGRTAADYALCFNGPKRRIGVMDAVEAAA